MRCIHAGCEQEGVNTVQLTSHEKHWHHAKLQPGSAAGQEVSDLCTLSMSLSPKGAPTINDLGGTLDTLDP